MWLLCAPNNCKHKKTLISEVKKFGVHVKTIDSLKREIGFHDFKAFYEIYKLCRKEKFDIIHTQSSKPGFLGRIAGKIAGCKKIVHTVQGHAFHQFERPLKRLLFYMLEIFSGFFCNKLILVNKYYNKYFWFIPKKNVKTIYNAIDFRTLKQKENREDDLVRLIFVGRLDKAKAPMDFLKALDFVFHDVKNIVANIVGDGEYFPKMKRFILNHKMKDRVKLLGWRSDVPDLLAKSDIFCLTSIFEAFGIVFCEAGFTGLPTVATNVEGIPEVVINGKTGILVPPKEPELFAKAIINLIHNKELAESMGKHAHKWVSDNFGVDQLVSRYCEVYEN